MVSWVPIIAAGAGKGQWRRKGWGQMILGEGLGAHQHAFSSISN